MFLMFLMFLMLLMSYYHYHDHYHHCHFPTGSWTHTTSLASVTGGHKDFAASGVAVYGSTIAVGSDAFSDVSIFSDTGSYVDSVTVSGIIDVAIYDGVIVAHSASTVHVFEVVTATWTERDTYSGSNIQSVAIYSTSIVVGGEGKLTVDQKMFF